MVRLFEGRWPLWFFAILVLLVPVGVAAQEDELDALDLEELMDVEVITASRRMEPLSQVAGAVTVLDEEDIFHSGATSVPEVLKLVPGVHVAQFDTDKWAVGIRGFNGLLSNKHLVLVDGRPITSPTTAGVAWGNTLPVNLIKRIEVVRGAWTHLWGSESFTGVINIITKTAEETQGGESITLVGTSGFEQSLRYGGELEKLNGFYRGYVKGAYKTGNMLSGDGSNIGSQDWVKGQAGVRVDWENAYTDALSFQGDLIKSTIKDTASIGPRIYKPHDRYEYNGYGQLNWNRATGLGSGINFRTSYSRDTMNVGNISGANNVIDAEVEHAMEQSGIHRLTWGVGARYFWDRMDYERNTALNLKSSYSLISNGYIQDRLTLAEDVFLTLGGKLDYFGSGNLEVQPTARLLHTREDSEWWLAVSRAVRADTRLQRDATYMVDKGGTVYTFVASGDSKTEEMISYEAGLRHRPVDSFEYDISVYVNAYDNLLMVDYDSATRTATLENDLQGMTYGIEVLGDWTVNKWLEFRPSASLLYQDVESGLPLPSDDAAPIRGLGSEIKLQTLTKLTDTVGFDFLIGYIDAPINEPLPGYFTLEAHGSWRASKTLLFELTGRNLGEASNQLSRLKVGPSIDLRVTWDF